jgi:hypothetical protein
MRVRQRLVLERRRRTAPLVSATASTRHLSRFVVAIAAALVAFGYWTHHDKRFLLPEDKAHDD